MPRRRIAPGEHGKITTTHRAGTWYASTYVRLLTGKLREREASSDKSAEAARRELQRRIKEELAATTPTGIITDRTNLAQLFETWIDAKISEDGLKDQSVRQYRQAWRVHGNDHLGELRIRELQTSRADAHLKTVPAGQATTLRVVLSGMFSMAVRFDVIATNPIAEAKANTAEKKPTRALTAIELEEVRQAVKVYCAPDPERPGIKARAPMLPAYVELLAATGDRPGEVLAVRWCDVDLVSDPATVTVSGTLLDHGVVPGKALHRQDVRKGKGGPPPHTVLLPKFGVRVLTDLWEVTGSIDGPVLTARGGGYISPSNIATSLREALAPHPHLKWVTPKSFRKTVATVVRDELGIDAAQQQLSHAKRDTTEQHYAQRRTQGPDARAALEKFAGSPS